MSSSNFVGLSYDKFKEIVPKETAMYVDSLLEIFRSLEVHNSSVKVLTGRVTEEDHIVFLAMLEALYQSSDELANYLNQIGYCRPEMTLGSYQLTTEEYQALFRRYSSYLPHLANIEDYHTLTPAFIPLELLRTLKSRVNSTSNVVNAIGGYSGVSSFYQNLAKLHKVSKNDLEKRLYQQFFDGVPIEVVTRIENACKKFQAMEESMDRYQSTSWLNTSTIEDKVAISMLLELTSTPDESDYASALVAYLTNHQLSFSKITDALGISNLYFSDQRSLSIAILVHWFNIFLKDVPDRSKMTVGDLVEKCFDRKLIGSIDPLKILSSLGGDISSISGVDAKVKEEIVVVKRQKSQKLIDDFYKDLSYETREFIDLTVKIYELLLKRMQEGKHNKDILLDEDDADTLALFIASYYVKGSVSTFFEGNGITLEDVLKLVNITLSKEEIDAMKVDGNILETRFKRFVFDGNNRSQMRERITIQSIILNLCNRDFNRSIIMEQIFTKLAHASLDKDFKKQLDKYMANVEKKRINNLRNDLFKDLPSQTINFLEQLSITHQMLDDLDLEAIQPLAIIYTISLANGYEQLGHFLRKYGLDSSHFEKHLTSRFNNNSNKKASYDVLNEYYRDYIFGGHNKDKKRSEIDVKSILANAFNKELSSTILMTKVLGESSLTYDSLQDFDKIFKAYEEEQAEEDLSSKRRAAWKYWDINTTTYMDNATTLFKRIKDKLQSAKDSSLTSFVTSDGGAEELALLLSMYADEKTKYIRDYFEHNNLTLQSILTLVGLDASIMDNLAKEEVDDKVAYEHFVKYLINERHSCDDLRFVVVHLLKDNISDSKVIETITKLLGGNYHFLTEEVENLAYHVEVLSPQERLERLRNQTISTIDGDDLQSIISFGADLSEHTKFIYDELPRRAEEDETGEELKRINDEMSSLYSKPTLGQGTDDTSKSQGFFGRLFARPRKEVALSSPQEPVLDLTLLDKVKKDINDCIKALSDETIGYDYIRKYLSLYRAKIIEHRRLFDQSVAELEAKLQRLSPEKEDEFDEYVTIEGNLRIMRSKAQRFATMQALATQEFVKVTQIIVDHSLSSDALELCRTHLLPFIGMENAISIGLGTEKQALDISETMTSLFHALLTRNITEITDNMARIQAAVPAERYSALEAQLESYLSNVKAYKEIEAKEDASSSSATPKVDSPFRLTLDPPTTLNSTRDKVKVYTNKPQNPDHK